MCLLLLPCLMLSSCTSINSYQKLFVKLSSYSDEVVINSYHSNDHYSEEGFIKYGGDICLYSTLVSTDYENYVFITLSNSSSVPKSYYCTFKWEHYSTSYSEVASFYIDNTYSLASSIYFDVYTGDSSMRQNSQDLAKAGVNLILTVFDGWLNDEFNSSMETVGMFPNY